MVRVFVLGAVDSGLILSRVIPMTLKLVFTASLFDAQHERDSVENKSVGLLGVSSRVSRLLVLLGKACSCLVGLPHLDVVDRWPATSQRARIAHCSLSRDSRINMQLKKIVRPMP